jgi:hypothetical protein
MPLLDLANDELLMMTRAVRKRLDHDRPGDEAHICEGVRIAMRSPSGSNAMTMQFVVRDVARRAEIGEIHRRCVDTDTSMDGVCAGPIRNPLAQTQGTDFEPAIRPDPDTIIHWDTW